jgi:cysteine-rich repeat protein
MRRILRRSLLPSAVALALLAPPALAETTKDLLGCQKTLEKEAAKLVKQRAKLLGACAIGLLDCALRNEVDGAPLAPCQTAAAAKCSEKLLPKAAAAELKLAAKAALKCPLSDASFRSRRGLGFRDAGDACAALVPPGSTAGTAAGLACVRRTAACAADDRVEETVPRAYELLSAAGLAASAPCLDPRPAAPGGPASVSAKDLLKCQKAIDGKAVVAEQTREKAIRSCAEAALKCDLPADRLETSLTRRAACRAATAGPCNGKRTGLAGKEASRDAAVLAKCGVLPLADVTSRLGFALTCGGATTIAEVGACLAAEVERRTERLVGTVTPRACALLAAVGQLGDYEDVCVPSCGNGVVEAGEACDDGNADPYDRCTNACTPGPVDLETALIPSPAAPPEVPDGTAGTAVPPGGTLATQFGTTQPDLNRATYTRFFAPGAGAPDAVLVLVPGFVGGAGSFKNLAESLIVRAEAVGEIRLEVWAYDRRTNQLEDAAGADLAEADLDGGLALDWFFGGALGLALDPRLDRRAVFHAGPDVAFLANLTPNVFTRDIDAVIEAARALPGPPAVFLGGHSLGTLFAARYAATDLDADFPDASVSPGYAKLAGLVLLEGGGGSTAGTPPTADQLDRVIAKADGGLFHAVRDGAGRCVDGTPCASDADCAAAPLPAGAVANRCVDSVEAYTGASTGGVAFINPQIQAAGNIAGIQGVLDPDGLVLLQHDFGAGSAVQNVPGLGILVTLPPASTEAAVGFFIDDDFSPVSAFRVSAGFSNNGPNQPFLGLVLPQASFTDPYRRWINVDQPQPAAAVPHNGFPTSNPSQVWGQEKEVTDLSRLFPSFFAAGTDFGDWYFPSSGLSTTAELVSLDSTPLSVGRGRPDIENLTQAGAIDVPVICFGGSNGLTTTAAAFKAFATSIGTCTAPSCTGVTPRLVVDNPINPLYGGVNGGFEAYISEGYAHVDVVTAEDDPAHNNVLGPLHAFLVRNTP